MILGILLRSPISSISIGVGWLLVVESIIALAWQASANWMPAQLLAIVASGGTSLRSQATLDYSQALIRVVIYIVLASVGAGFLFKKRDVSN